MVKDLDIVEKLRKVNGIWWPAYTFYLNRNLAYWKVYGIMGSYKDYLSRLQIVAQNKFNEAMFWLQIEVKHDFAIQ